MVKDLISAAPKVGKIVDDVNYSGEERGKDINERHERDMTSDSWLSKNVRPIVLIYLMLAFSACLAAVICGVVIDPWITGEITAMLMAAFGFYFNSKKHERVAQKNAQANIEINKMETKHKIEVEKIKLKQEEKKDRALRRLERIQARRKP